MTASPTDDLASAEHRIQDLTKELAEASRQQSATSEILRVISSSPNESHRVFQEIAASAARLCDAYDAGVLQRDGDHLRVVGHYGPMLLVGPVGQGKLPLTRGSLIGRIVLDRQTLHVSDMQAEADEYPYGSEVARQFGFHTILAVPLMRAGEAIGLINVRRTELRPFTDRQIELLKTFADQAVIAIENTRLFEEVQERTRDLTESLKQQTATSEVLSVISSSPTDVQPVLDAIVKTAVKLCNSHDAVILLKDVNELHIVAHHGPMAVDFARIPIARDTVAGRSIVDRVPVHIDDLADETQSVEFPLGQHIAVRLNQRTVLGLPLLREGHAIGCLFLRRTELLPFTEKQIALLQTFADQAVIAIENTRLFEEVRARTRDATEALEYQTATSDVLEAISRSKFDLQPVLDTIVKTASRLCAAEDVAILLRDGGVLRVAAHDGTIVHSQLNAETPAERDFVGGRTVVDRQPIQVPDLTVAGEEFPRGRGIALRLGIRTSLGVPLLREDVAIGCLLLRRKVVQPFDEKQIALLQTFADQAVIAIENTRLFEEVQARTRELAQTVEDLEIASQHKNQFVANMSHELRTPLAAILGYAELIQEGFYEPQGPKSRGALTRICSNGKHLLGLINTVLDIAKIESGQFTLNMTEYAIESVVETVRAATESLAQNKKLTFTTSVGKSLPIGLGDEQRLTQVLLNLVGNAIKFTDAGEVSISAGAREGHFAVSVTDTGPGIPLDQQGRIFEQFHQVDSSMTKAKGGTGLGLAIAKQIVEMHGGRIWVVSTPGKGSTFQMELPTRAEFRNRGL